MTVVLVLGTRPEIIKMAPLVRALRAKNIPHRLLHTGQHYSASLDAVFFRELRLPAPDANLNIGSKPAAIQTAEMLAGMDPLFREWQPSCILVEGDTNSVLAGALAAVKQNIPLVHVEAGLRSGDRTMPEEVNRILTDHASDLLCAPTKVARQNLRRENIPAAKILVTGNTVVDAVRQHLPLAEKPGRQGDYLVATTHRAENVESQARLRGILQGMKAAAKAQGMPVILPMHPHTRKMVEQFGLTTQGLEVVEPLGYLGFLGLLAGARAVITDSGGVQEEACILQVPCVTVRDNTERPETITVGANALAGTNPQAIVRATQNALTGRRRWRNPFGDGRASQRIVAAVERKGWTRAEHLISKPRVGPRR